VILAERSRLAWAGTADFDLPGHQPCSTATTPPIAVRNSSRLAGESMGDGRPRVLVAGGGIAGMEALLALADLAGDRVENVLVAPDTDFRYRPMAVDEPFSLTPYERRELGPAVSEAGGRFVRRAVRGLRPGERVAELEDGSRLDYDAAVICVGARARPAFAQAFNFVVPGPPLEVADLLERAREGAPHRIAFVVPSGVTWSLPLYELALLTARRVTEQREDAEVAIVTPEASPLAIFGAGPSEAVAELLRARGIAFHGGVHAREAGKGVLALTPGETELQVATIVALPILSGPGIDGVPTDQNGFIPVDDHARVYDLDAVYAAGDGTNFPIKQGGLGTQQADAAAEHIAARFGAELEPRPFRPVLRGKLLLGDETMSMRADIAGGAGEGVASLDSLWWPPFKVSGRYLTPWLAGAASHVEPEPPLRSIDVEVSLPRDWHREPMALDPYTPIDS
jgi:sulfide:quinone oxidoreductase